MLSSFKGEAKQEVAAEAAADPNSKFNAEDAERVIVDESKKAGAAAFQFDPNASPEEKAAQARARSNNLHTNRPKGAGLKSDINTGPDDYDLPPPTPASAIAKIPENEKKADANGAPTEDEKWKKTGWAPRLGTGQTAEEKADDALISDHQTLLEGKLDDKFFGDWYHNAAVIVFACLASWLVAVLGGGLAWVLLVMATCGTYYRTSIRRVRRNFRDDITRELAKNRLESDHESLEWMNSFLVKFWPVFAPNLAVSVIQSVDQVLSTSTPAFLDSMRMETFTLGTKPPRMEHVKTYPRAEDDIVMMDWRFSFTPNDTMDMTARQLKNKINPKVVLEIRIGKAMVSKAMKIIVEDFAFSGLMRIKMKLQLPFPYIDRVDMCFLERPDIDYVCKPFGGETFGFDINFIPGLESFIKEQIHANLAPIMYAPNVFPIEVAKMLSGNPIDQAIGVVAITLHGAQALRNPDKFAGTPDPYTVVSINGRNELARTKTIQQNADPRWNETLYIIITSFNDSIHLQVFDFNDIRKDKDLGTAIFPLEKLESLPAHENEQLEVIAGGKQRGLINCDIRFFPVLGGSKDAEGHDIPPPETNTGIARITIEQAKELDGSKSMVGQLNPYGVLLLNGKEVHVTGKLKRTNNPIFTNPSTSVLVTDRRKARIGLVIKDDRDLAGDPIVGRYQVKLDDMLTLQQKGQEWVNLHDSKTGRAKMLIDWKPVALTGIAISGGYITPIGVLRVHFKKAHDLRNLETLGKSDPYGRVLLNGIQKGRTVTFKNNLEPTWDEVVYVPIHTVRERITLEVMDEETLGKDRSLGQMDIALSEYIKENEQDGGYLVHDTKHVFNDGLRMQGKGPAKGTLTYTVSFFPTLNVIDPEEEKEEKEALPATPTAPSHPAGSVHSKASSIDHAASTNGAQPSVEGRKSLENAGKLSVEARSENKVTPSISESVVSEKKLPPKIRLTVNDLPKYESGLLIFHITEGTFASTGVRLEVLIDDHTFPSYSTSKVRQRHHVFGETGDAFIRELDFSRITLRLVEKSDKDGDDGDEYVAKLQGQTLQVLSQCLYTPTELTLKGDDGSVNKVTVSLKYLPVQMQLDPSESINNMGTLRVDVDAADLPAADRNGFSDPYCKFKLNGKEIHKTKTQKKTLHPAWNETFETMVASRTAADFRIDVYDWDFGDKADYLGGANINLAALEPFEQKEFKYALDGKSGVVRLKMSFKPSYVTRARQGTSTFYGTFAPAGKVVGAPVKGVTMVGGGVVKGASFLKRGFTGRSNKDEPAAVNGSQEGGLLPDGPAAPATPGTPARSAALVDTNSPLTPSSTNHNRQSSYASTAVGGAAKGADNGIAQFTIVSASGFPEKADVQVHVNMKSAKGKTKELYKTKHLKPKDGVVIYGDEENFKVTCPADTSFQMIVKGHEVFRDKELGEAMFFVSDQGNGTDQQIKVGSGTVTIRSSFTPEPSSASAVGTLRPTTSGRDSPISKKEGTPRKSFFGKRDASGTVDGG